MEVYAKCSLYLKELDYLQEYINSRLLEVTKSKNLTTAHDALLTLATHGFTVLGLQN